MGKVSSFFIFSLLYLPLSSNLGDYNNYNLVTPPIEEVHSSTLSKKNIYYDFSCENIYAYLQEIEKQDLLDLVKESICAQKVLDKQIEHISLIKGIAPLNKLSLIKGIAPLNKGLFFYENLKEEQAQDSSKLVDNK